MKVLISDTFSQEGLQVFESAEGITLDYQPGISSDDLQVAIRDAEALVVRGGTRVSAELLESAACLKVIGRAGIGIENMDLAAANRKGVVVMNTPFGSTTTTAEHTLAMLFSLARNIPRAHISTSAGNWDKEQFLGIELAGKTLGVIGAGKIGRLVVERARALKMNVVVHDPYLPQEMVRQLGASQLDLDRLLAEADFITLHVPLNQETENLLGEKQLQRCKPGCRIINCATGGLIDEQALAKAIAAGQIGGAALDVFSQEPPAADNPLLRLPEVICTPHLRAATVDAQINVTVQVARQIVAFLQRGEVINALNVPSVSAELLAEIRPYVQLGEKLGALLTQLSNGAVRKLNIEYAGDITAHPMAPLTMAVLNGLLQPVVGSMVNYVNAPFIAKERGIDIVEAKSSQSEGYATLMRVTIEDESGSRSVCGGLFGDRARIVKIDHYDLETSPEGPILILYNHDQPGVVGYIGQLLGEAEINIARMNLARGSGEALTVLNIDTPIPDDVLERIRSHQAIRSAIQVIL
ncbi:phosphoglycerate dehydrogenase [Geothermobacter hydrogeniphilus]|uniref:D-3-phosphoglycerate dehydrogenase n=1 Tax=Geothermobacter hydrogeniphilus TaxID=1969733 RepID=A0A2K2HEP2_9BACT|nr:phosphoglycerate dehydrogenase [Geothermobacter hydrogeniphilus]PNU21750.1 phosphoglycerate dehydrogenase [Geothermobacter hydrogeniphilus]